jgi:hypothetical protein
MPKELIVNRRDRMFDTVVSWSRDASYVQVGTLMAPPQTSDASQNLKQLVQSWADDASDPESPDGATGLFNELGRSELNELIRVLRRARDQAFGKDE